MRTLFRNGKIFTGDAASPYAEAMIAADGRIEAVGFEKDLDAAGCETVDLGGRRVIPGLIDSHMHGLLLAEYSKQISCLPPEVNSIEELVTRIREVRSTVAPGTWIKGWGYDEGKLAEHRAPNRYDLDRGASDTPVFIARTCVHIASVNSLVLEMAGITKDTPDPPGGHIVKDENGEPTGVLEENARNLVFGLMPAMTIDEQVRDIVDLGELLLSQGITAFTDMGSFWDGDAIDYYDAAVRAGLRQEVAVYYLWDKARKSGNYTIDEETMSKDRQIRAAGLKLLSDGSISGQTAYVDIPFLGTDNYGIYEMDEELFEDAIAFCKAHHCQLSVHAMGGRAIEKVVDRVAEEEDWMTDDTPYARLEHVTEPKESSLAKVVAHGIMFATQPIFQYSEIESYLVNLGPERTKVAYPVRHMLDKGVEFSLSTDAPATSWAVPSDPWTNLKAAVTRVAYDGTDCGKDQALDIGTALRLYTEKAAKICGFRDMGQLKPGYKANFAVLSEDVLAVPAERIGEVKAEETYILGKRVYRREQ